MGNVLPPSAYLLFLWGVITAVLVILMIYRSTLSIREDDQIFLDKEEEVMMAAEQRLLMRRMNRLARPLTVLAVLSGVLLLASGGVWLWTGFNSF
jgi:Tfp pilus assembly protein PilN